MNSLIDDIPLLLYGMISGIWALIFYEVSMLLCTKKSRACVWKNLLSAFHLCHDEDNNVEDKKDSDKF